MHKFSSRVAWALPLLLLTAAALWLPAQSQTRFSGLFVNGDFEQGFREVAGCAAVPVEVPLGWGCFSNLGRATYGFYNDMWDPVVVTGESSVLIEINTFDFGIPDNDRYAGIYQTVRVVPGEPYTIGLTGMIRTTEFGPNVDPGRYRVQVGWIYEETDDWTAVENWQDVGFNNYYPRLEPGRFERASIRFTAEDEIVTIFFRVWKKWGVPFIELDVNLDDLTLIGLAPTIVPTPTPDLLQLSTVGWPRATGLNVAFNYPGPWAPAPDPGAELDPTVLEAQTLGIPGEQIEESLRFYTTDYYQVIPPDTVELTDILIGGKAGTKRVRQNQAGGAVIYEYCAPGFVDVGGSFCVRVAAAENDPQLELQLDRLVNSIEFF